TSPRLPPSASSFFFQHTSPTETYTLSLHDALPIWRHTALLRRVAGFTGAADPGYEHRPGDVLQRRLAPLSPSLSHRPLRRWPRPPRRQRRLRIAGGVADVRARLVSLAPRGVGARSGRGACGPRAARALPGARLHARGGGA